MSDHGWGLGTKFKIDGENTPIEVIHNHNGIQVKDMFIKKRFPINS